jgi:hypothetical protein
VNAPNRGPTVEGDYAIAPAMIRADEALMDSFDHMETEISAGWVCRFMQERGAWVAFTREEIDAFYQRQFPGARFGFNRLVDAGTARSWRGSYPAGGGWVVLGDDGKYRVTEDFIKRYALARAPS